MNVITKENHKKIITEMPVNGLCTMEGIPRIGRGGFVIVLAANRYHGIDARAVTKDSPIPLAKGGGRFTRF